MPHLSIFHKDHEPSAPFPHDDKPWLANFAGEIQYFESEDEACDWMQSRRDQHPNLPHDVGSYLDDKCRMALDRSGRMLNLAEWGHTCAISNLDSSVCVGLLTSIGLYPTGVPRDSFTKQPYRDAFWHGYNHVPHWRTRVIPIFFGD